MTFRDNTVLDEENEDLLENIELQSSFKQKMLMKRKQEGAVTKYNGTEAGAAAALEGAGNILSHYDDPDEEARLRKDRITLADDGGRSKE
jgi:hypothetical protein